MTTRLVYRLAPQRAFHFGAHGIDAEESTIICPSDTLYAALLIEAQRAGLPFFAPDQEHNDDRALNPPLLLSSCFPYAGEVLLLPLPRLKLPLTEKEGERKRFKELKYVSPTIFRLIIEGREGVLEEYFKNKGTFCMGGAVWVAHTDGTLPAKEPFWKIESVPHVTVDRVQMASNYYQVGQVYFAAGCGVYTLCEERVPGAANHLYELFQRLGDSGLGGRRSSGVGQFRVAEPSVLDLPDVASPPRLLLLSRYRPSPGELAAGVLGPAASYELGQVGGWLQSLDPNTPSQRRRTLRLLNEGSVIQTLPDGLPTGTICDVRPQYSSDQALFPHPVWRYGLALGVGIGGS